MSKSGPCSGSTGDTRDTGRKRIAMSCIAISRSRGHMAQHFRTAGSCMYRNLTTDERFHTRELVRTLYAVFKS